MNTTKVYYWYNGNNGVVIYDVVNHKGDMNITIGARLHQIGIYKELTGMHHMVYTVGTAP